MGLSPNDKLGGAIRGAVRGIYRISIIKRALDSGLAFLQAYGHGDPDDALNQELLQEADIDHAGHFGLSSHPPQDTEAIVVDADGGAVCIAERDSLEDLDTHGTADEMPALATGDTCLYSQDGTYILLDSSGNLTIKAMTGNVEIITEAGDQIKLGQDGATYRDIAYAHTGAGGASQVAARIELETWTDGVKSDMADIKADLLALIATVNIAIAQTNVVIGWSNIFPIVGVSGALALAAAVAPTLTPDTVANIAEDTDFAYVSSGSTKAEVEP